MQKITPCLWFDHQARQVMELHTALFSSSQVLEISYYNDAGPGEPGSVLIANYRLANLAFQALNGGPHYQITPAISFFVHCQSQAEIDTLWAGLTEGGSVLMPLEPYPFSQKFGWCMDRYGVSWQLSLTGQPQAIAPFLMFTGAQNGKAAEAIQCYSALFPDSGIEHIERYGADEGGTPGSVKHASFRLNGQEFMASDNSYEHGFGFTPGLSFSVNCRDQAEVDRLWDSLSEGGQVEQCGWLTDRYGVSWQIVPEALGRLMQTPDPEKARRVSEAMLKMRKLDVAALEAAARG